MRRGSATVELAVVLPVLMLFALLAVDFGRFGKYSITVANAARNGAMYAAQNTSAMNDTAGISSAAMADITNNLEVNSSKVTITSGTGTDTEGRQQVWCQVQVEFDLFYNLGTHNINYGGGFDVVDKCYMRVRP